MSLVLAQRNLHHANFTHIIASNAESKKEQSPSIKVTKDKSRSFGESAEIPLKTLVRRRQTDLKFRLTVMMYMANSVGMGFTNTADLSNPQGRKCLEIVNDFTEECDLDVLNQKMARDVWTSGNGFWNPVGSLSHPLEAMFMVPLSSISRIDRESDGTIINYIQDWGTTFNKKVAPEDIYHFNWLAEDESAFGEGLGQPMERKGVGYTSMAGNKIQRPSWFSADEMIADTSMKMLYSGLPRYNVSLESGQDQPPPSEEMVDKTNEFFNKMDPLMHYVSNVKTTVSSISLDTNARFDSTIRRLDDEFISGTMSPLIRLWSSMNFTFASSKEAVDAMMPLIKVYQRAHKRFVERNVYRVLIAQEKKDVKKANVRLNWGLDEPLTVDDLKQVFEILKDPKFADRFDADSFIDLLIEAGIPIAKQEADSINSQMNSYRDLLGVSDNKAKTRDLLESESEKLVIQQLRKVRKLR